MILDSLVLNSSSVADSRCGSAENPYAATASSEVIAKIQTKLSNSATKVWKALLKRDTFLHVTRGMLGFKGAEGWPDVFDEGQVIEARLLLFNVVPCWKHTTRVVRVDDQNMELVSQEGGGMVKRWHHRIWIDKESECSCSYTDEVDIDAGFLTFFIWIYAHVFYRYRQRRWRQLAKRLCRT